MSYDLTLVAVHAHPDDESTSTGGILARYAREGVRTVVVTCTNGELGDALNGAKPGAEGHDPQEVAATRIGELRNAVKHLEVTDLELLGYHDSGMVNWEDKHRPDVFCNVPAETAAARVAALIERYRPQVVVTYDPESPYQHPDHVHAARIATMATESTGIPAKLYYKANGAAQWNRIFDELAQLGMPRPPFGQETLQRWADIDARTTTTVDVSEFVEQKRLALHSHVSQLASAMTSKLPAEVYARVFTTETYIRAHDTTGAPIPEDDLFAGLR
ncbi:PIG-L family deacetylase [Kutzneria sp. NPDC052558]|uniref:PIG-L family deacetylase n=1 Tax=Kutzneria sp. NPDC052558 TaxID=3364121 RepID=UPI0037C9DE51